MVYVDDKHMVILPYAKYGLHAQNCKNVFWRHLQNLAAPPWKFPVHCLWNTGSQYKTATYGTLTEPKFSKPFLVATWWATSFPGSPWSRTRNELVNTSPVTWWFAKNTASTRQQKRLHILHVDEELFPERMSHVTTMASFEQKPNSLLLAVAADSSPNRRPPLDINPPTLCPSTKH